MIARAILAIVMTFAALDPAVVKEIEDFRAKHETDYRRDYVTLAGLKDKPVTAAIVLTTADGESPHRARSGRRENVSCPSRPTMSHDQCCCT